MVTNTLRSLSLLSLLAFGVATANAQTIGYWRFEGASTATAGANNDWLDDYSGNNRNLTINGTTSQGAIPATGPGAEFHDPIPQTAASNDNLAAFGGGYLSTPDDPAFTDNTFSIEAYFNAASFATNSGGVTAIAGQFNGSANQRSWLLSLNSSGQVELILSGAGTDSNRIASGFTITTGVDYYVAFTANVADTSSSGITFYSQILSGGGAGALSNGTGLTHTVTNLHNSMSALTIGALGNGGNIFNGVIDEVRLSDTVLARSNLLAIPEPTSIVLLLSGIGIVLGLRRRRF